MSKYSIESTTLISQKLEENRIYDDAAIEKKRKGNTQYAMERVRRKKNKTQSNLINGTRTSAWIRCMARMFSYRFLNDLFLCLEKIYYLVSQILN